MLNPKQLDSGPAFSVARVQAFALRWPVKRPVQTSFGTMHDRPAVLVRVEGADGAVGWGEVWCNFPACGAEHRVRLLETVVAPLVMGQAFARAEDAFARMSERTAVLAIQSGEPGPMAQVIAGIDCALWDMLARRQGVPLWQLLGGSSGRVQVYASGINPDRPQDTVAAKHAEGYRMFKLKVGFGRERDMANIAAVHAHLPPGCAFMLDANQAWDLATATQMARLIEAYAPLWLEEPLRADRPASEWRSLKQATTLPLAAGENLMGLDAFQALCSSGALAVVQPDVAKWGGVSGCLPVIDMVQTAGLLYCPHFLGAGVGQLASAHLLAARGLGAGMLEIDSNENPLRTALSPALNHILDGYAELGHGAGIGVEPDLQELRQLCDSHTGG